MATAHWTPADLDKQSIVKKVSVPRRASGLSQWLKQVHKTIPEVPTNYGEAKVEIDVDHIRINWPTVGWLWIDRTTRKAI